MQTLQWAVLGQDQGRLHHAIERGGPDNIKLDSCSPFSPLSLAAGIGNYDITKLLLDEGRGPKFIHPCPSLAVPCQPPH